MDRVLAWMRENPQLAALSFGAAVLAVVMTLLAITMLRAGASLRPLIWFLGYFGIIAGPQAVVHLLDGLLLQRAAESSAATETVSAASAPTLQPISWATVFGPKADPALITDPKRPLGAILGDALDAKLSFNSDGESALAARFPSAAAAIHALGAYGRFFVVAEATGSDATGWTARRHGGQGEWVHIVTAGPELYAWTALSRERVLENRTRALGPVVEMQAASPEPPSPELASQRLRSKPRLMFAIVGLNLVAAVFWFFKGSAWATRVEGSHAVLPAAAQVLRQDLVALNERDVPWQAIARPDGSVEINWRYADARWFDLMRVHQMTRTHRLLLTLDERDHTVRVREYWSEFDASGGVGGLQLSWKMNAGIQFFAYEHQRVFGAQLGSDGKPTGELSKAYTFDLQSLKAPVIETVTRAGWKWQPVMWNAPAAFRWLTE